jgi:hypothetical protein
MADREAFVLWKHGLVDVFLTETCDSYAGYFCSKTTDLLKYVPNSILLDLWPNCGCTGPQWMGMHPGWSVSEMPIFILGIMLYLCFVSSGTIRHRIHITYAVIFMKICLGTTPLTVTELTPNIDFLKGVFWSWFGIFTMIAFFEWLNHASQKIGTKTE